MSLAYVEWFIDWDSTINDLVFNDKIVHVDSFGPGQCICYFMKHNLHFMTKIYDILIEISLAMLLRLLSQHWFQ